MKKVITLIMDIGEQMLINGAEVSRVEDSLRRMGTAYGAARVDAFIITSNMQVSVFGKDGKTYTQTRRITDLTTNIEKLHRLNALARKICKDTPDPEAVESELKSISSTKRYPTLITILCHGIISSSFSIFFGGSLNEAVCALFVGLLTGSLVSLCEKGNLNRIFARFFCSFAATLLAFATAKLGLAPTADHIIIGTIMTLIPGVGLTVALRDLFSGDSISGLLRTVEALLLAIAIVGGYFLSAAIFGGVL